MRVALLVGSIPSPSDNAIGIGPLQLRAYGLAIAVGGYGVGRLWVEALRIDDATRLAGLRVNIWVSLLAVTASAVALAVLHHQQRDEPPASPPHTTIPVLGRPEREHQRH